MIDVVIMAGGRGSRLGGVKKQFMRVCGRKLVEVALEAARTIGGRKIYLCVTEEDLALLRDVAGPPIEVVACPGAGYVEDLNCALSHAEYPVLVLPADIPFLTAEAVGAFLEAAQRIPADVVTLMVCREGSCSETGISFFRSRSGRWANVYFEDSVELRDIDTPDDLSWAERLCGSTEGIKKQE